MNEYQFAETEKAHAERLGGNQHRTRQLRRAILYILTGYEYSELVWYLVGMGLGKLLKMAAVSLEEDGRLIPHGKPSDKEFLVSVLGTNFAFADPTAPQRKKLEMLSRGLFQGNIPYPYTGYDGAILCPPEALNMVMLAFSTLTLGSYTDVASALNRAGYKSATKKSWSKDTARSFCQNPVHAGYAVTYKDRRPDGSADKRGGLILTRLTEGFPEPPISYEEWFACNLVMRKREIIMVVPSARKDGVKVGAWTVQGSTACYK
jgi:hypothetical protein